MRTLIKILLILLSGIVWIPSLLNAQGTWTGISFTGVAPKARHENAFVQAGNRFYLLGGRGSAAANVQVKVFNYNTNVWADGGQHPLEMHHFQAVELNGLIYAIGVMTGGFPTETPVPEIYIYNPAANEWVVGPTIPVGRRRGSAGAVAYNGKIYVIAGIQNGHQSGWVPWTDVYDPATNTWTELADAPHSRDHFQAVLSGSKIYVAGGRRSGSGANTFQGTVQEVDIYDIPTDTWTTLPLSDNIPTERAGTMACLHDNHVVVIGGENDLSTAAEDNVEALDLNTLTWTTWNTMMVGRHASQPIANNGRIYIAAGASPNRGGTNIPGTDANYLIQGDFSGGAPVGTAITASDIDPTANSLNYGIVSVGNTGTLTSILVSSAGNQATIIEDIQITGANDDQFALDLGFTLPVVIPPGGSLNIPVDFIPTTTGLKSATLEITHTGGNAAVNVALSGDGGSAPTPVELLSFSALPYEKIVKLRWITASEMNNDFFTIERSRNGYLFEEVIRLSGKGDGNLSREYETTDYLPYPGWNYYRLSQTDFDGKTEKFPLVQVYFDGTGNPFRIYPNPVESDRKLNIESLVAEPGKTSVTLINFIGQAILRREIEFVSDRETLSFGNLPAGTYFLIIRGERGEVFSEMVEVR
ncbi:MAG: kelch repeat-containing protein [Bacteroidia bacterium]|nr:kelch repeat-containing protein [Bacteroidia bacterium]